MHRFSAAETAARAEVRRAFAGSRIYCRRDRRGGCTARIDLPSGSWCSTRGADRADAVLNCLALAREPAPGFPGWIEPNPDWRSELEELALT
jgi:hypothetical protein